MNKNRKYTEATASLSLCGKYRFALYRAWNNPNKFEDDADGDKLCTWLMLNPSTADGQVDDATVRRCVTFTDSWGYQRMLIVNLFTWRACDPSLLDTAEDPVGPAADQCISRAAVESSLLVAGWGAYPSRSKSALVRARPRQVIDLITQMGQKLYVLGLNADQSPKHPLYLSRKSRLAVHPAFVPSVLHN